MKCHLINLGCKVNAYETESTAQMLEAEGFERTDSMNDADVTVIFTCAVTNTAAAKSRKQIHRARRANPDGVIAVAGCYAQIDPDALAEADILIGSAHKPLLPQYIRQFLRDRIPLKDVTNLSGISFEPMYASRFAERTRAFLKIQDGCDQFCTYCVIPYARGRERSLDPDSVIREVACLAQSHQEIVLAGIHTGRYGKEYGITLTGLLKRILNEVPQLARIRISSIEVTELSDEFVELLVSEPRIARHLHVPVQSGCDTVLARMGRPYTTDEYYSVISRIREQIPDISISTDLMVGFPGETEEEFQQTLAFLKKCWYSFLHVFPYSLRKGTAAEQLPDHCAPDVKKERTAVCLAESEALYEAYVKSMIDHPVEVLMETEKTGYTSEYIEVTMDRPCKKGSMIKAVITGYHDGIAEAKENDFETE